MNTTTTLFDNIGSFS